MVDEKDMALIKTEKEPAITFEIYVVGKVACVDVCECVMIMCACIKP